MVNRVTKRGLALLLAFSIVFPIFGNLVQVQAASGTSENPYSVSEAIVKQDGAMAFVEGYVVGHYNTSNKKVFGSTHPTQLNLLLADSADSTEVLAVQVAKAARGEYTADLINTKVKLKGTLADYFGQEGLKNVSAIERVAESSPVETSAEVVETTAEMVETFEEVLETSVETPVAKTYTISFGENLGKAKKFGGNIQVPENIVSEENTVVKLPEAVENEVSIDWTSPFKFMGWKLDGQGELLAPGTEVTVTADQNYVAIYERVTGLFTFRFSFYKEDGCQLSNPKNCELTDENGNLLRDSIRKNANDKEDYTLTSGDLVFYHNPINTSKDSINFDEVKPDLTYTVKLNLPEGVKIDAERMAAQRDLSNFTDNTFDILVRPKSSTHNNKVIYLLKEEKLETNVIFNLVDENGNKIEGLDPVEKKAPVTLKEGQTSTLRLRSKDLPEGYGFVSGTSFPAEVLYGETKEVNVPVKAKKTQVTVSFSYKDKNGTSQTMPELTFTEIYEEGNTNFVDNGDGTLTYTLPADKIPAGYEKAMESDGIAKVDKYGKGYLLVELKHTPAEIEIASPVLVEGDTGVKVKTGNLEKDDVIKILVDGEEVGEFKMPFVGSTNRTITVEPELVEGQNVEATVERNGVEVGRSESKPVESKIDIEITSPVLVDGDKGVKVKAGNLEKDDVIEIRVDGKKIGEYKMPFAGAPSRTIDVDSALVAGQKVEAIIRRSGTEMGRSAEKIVEEKKEIEITSTPLKAGDNNVSVSTGDLVKGDVIEIRVDGKKITDYILPFDGVTVKRTIDLGIDLEEGQVVEAVVRRSGVEMARSEEVVVEAIETTEEETTAEETTAEETTVEETTVEETSVEETTLEETTVEETTLEETSVEEITEEETTSETTEEETTVEETTLEETTAEETTVETTEETTVETTEETSVETTQEETTEETSVETTQEETTEETTAETVEESDKKEIAFLTFKFEGVLDGMTEAFQIEAKVGDTIIIPDAPVREGFVFDYWKGSVYHPGDKYLVEDDHVFTAMWKNEETTEEPVSQEPQETTGELIEKDPTDKTEEPKQDTSSDKSEKSNEDNVAGGKVQSETKGTGTKTEGKNLSLNPQTSDEGILVYGVVLVLALAADFIIRKKMREEITK